MARRDTQRWGEGKWREREREEFINFMMFDRNNENINLKRTHTNFGRRKKQKERARQRGDYRPGGVITWPVHTGRKRGGNRKYWPRALKGAALPVVRPLLQR